MNRATWGPNSEELKSNPAGSFFFIGKELSSRVVAQALSFGNWQGGGGRPVKTRGGVDRKCVRCNGMYAFHTRPPKGPALFKFFFLNQSTMRLFRRKYPRAQFKDREITKANGYGFERSESKIWGGKLACGWTSSVGWKRR